MKEESQRKAHPYAIEEAVYRATDDKREARASGTRLRTDRKESIRIPIRQCGVRTHMVRFFTGLEIVASKNMQKVEAVRRRARRVAQSVRWHRNNCFIESRTA